MMSSRLDVKMPNGYSMRKRVWTPIWPRLRIRRKRLFSGDSVDNVGFEWHAANLPLRILQPSGSGRPEMSNLPGRARATAPSIPSNGREALRCPSDPSPPTFLAEVPGPAARGSPGPRRNTSMPRDPVRVLFDCCSVPRSSGVRVSFDACSVSVRLSVGGRSAKG